MKTIIQDTADVVFRRKSDGKVIFTAESQLASINQSVTTERIKGGIGNKDLAVLKSAKEIALAVRNAVFDRDWLEMAQGVSFANGTAIVWKKEEIAIVDATGTLEATITGTVATDGATKLYNKEGDEVEATFSTTKFTITDTGVEAGDKVTALYQTEVTGDVLEIRGDTFSEAYEVEYHTIEYSPETNKVVKDLYFQFDQVTPEDSFDLSFENGSAITPEFNFTALTPIGSDVIGKVIEVDRVVTP